MRGSRYDAVTARTAIGLSRDGRNLTLFTVDVRGGSEGMRVGEVADVLMKDYGAWNALNLDGGGSTSMAMEDPATHNRSIVNVLSDNRRVDLSAATLRSSRGESRIPSPESRIATPSSSVSSYTPRACRSRT
jgi:hypothetical protein